MFRINFVDMIFDEATRNEKECFLLWGYFRKWEVNKILFDMRMTKTTTRTANAATTMTIESDPKTTTMTTTNFRSFFTAHLSPLWCSRSWFSRYAYIKATKKILHTDKWWTIKKVFYKSEGKMHKKMKMTLQRAKNLVHVKQDYGVSFYKKDFLLILI